MVIVRNTENFTEFYPEITSYIGEFDFGLSASGDAVRLFNSDLILHDEVYYESTSLGHRYQMGMDIHWN